MPFALLVVILGIALLVPPVSAQPAPRVRVEPSGNVTVQARNVPLSVVLARLAAEGVEVVVPELQLTAGYPCHRHRYLSLGWW